MKRRSFFKAISAAPVAAGAAPVAAGAAKAVAGGPDPFVLGRKLIQVQIVRSLDKFEIPDLLHHIVGLGERIIQPVGRSVQRALV